MEYRVSFIWTPEVRSGVPTVVVLVYLQWQGHMCLIKKTCSYPKINMIKGTSKQCSY